MTDPHRNTPVVRVGAQLAQARAAVVLLHGRGASAEDILGLAQELELAQKMDRPGIAWLAPQAAGNAWYPYSFMAPLEQNEPWLSSALAKVASVVEQCTEAGLAKEKIAVCGFSQGACLGIEFIARNPAHWGALIALTGGLIGPEGLDLRHHGSLEGTQCLLSSGDPDPHVPWLRVQESARELERMGAQVELMRHPGRPHTIIASEVQAAAGLIDALVSDGTVS
jgi:phospholipase/carboxylesterase